jgi:hypothetical protein
MEPPASGTRLMNSRIDYTWKMRAAAQPLWMTYRTVLLENFQLIPIAA